MKNSKILFRGRLAPAFASVLHAANIEPGNRPASDPVPEGEVSASLSIFAAAAWMVSTLIASSEGI